MKHQTARLVAEGAGVIAIGSALMGSRQWRAWHDAEDPCGPDLLTLPDGEERTVTVSDGATLAMTIAGEGPTVVFAHGWTNARSVWAAVSRRVVASGHRVVLYDQRGHGKSTVGSEGITIARLGADLREILEHLDVHHATLVGHSMGGMTIMALAADQPSVVVDRVGAIVLVATAAHELSSGAIRDAIGARVVGSPLVSKVMSGRTGPVFARISVGAKPRFTHLAAAASLFATTPAAARRDCLLAMAKMDVRSGLATIRVPVTVVLGTRDGLTSPRLGRQIAAEVPRSRLVELPRLGHMLMFEAPDKIAELIIESASQVPQSALAGQ